MTLPDPMAMPDKGTKESSPPKLGRVNVYAGVAVVVMATGITAGLGTSLVIAALEHTAVTEQFASLLSVLGGAVVGSIATYLGSRK